MFEKLFILFSIITLSPIWGYYYVKLLGEFVDRRFQNGKLISSNTLNIPTNELTPFEEILYINEQNSFILIFGFGFYYFTITIMATLFFFHHVWMKLYS